MIEIVHGRLDDVDSSVDEGSIYSDFCEESGNGKVGNGNGKVGNVVVASV